MSRASFARRFTELVGTSPLGDDKLAAARSELGLDVGAPVPLRLRVGFT
jgi:hypothetical protein